MYTAAIQTNENSLEYVIVGAPKETAQLECPTDGGRRADGEREEESLTLADEDMRAGRTEILNNGKIAAELAR